MDSVKEPTANLIKIVESPEQRGAALWRQASDIIDTYFPILVKEVSRDGEETYLVTPWANVDIDGEVDGRRVRKNAAFAIAAQVEGGKYKKTDPLYLVIDHNSTSPLLKFDTASDGLMRLDDSFGTVNDRSIEQVLEHIAEESRRQKNIFDSNARDRRGRAVGWLVFGAVIGTAATVSLTIHRLIDDHTNAINQKIRDFDSKDIQLPATAIKANSTGFPAHNLSLFNQFVPSLKGTNILSSPREIKLSAGSCQSVGSIPVNQNVRIVTNAPFEQSYAAVDGQGTVSICILENPYEDSSNQASYEFALQRS